jgi:hypothetical protein
MPFVESVSNQVGPDRGVRFMRAGHMGSCVQSRRYEFAGLWDQGPGNGQARGMEAIFRTAASSERRNMSKSEQLGGVQDGTDVTGEEWRIVRSGGGHGAVGQTSFTAGRCALSRDVRASSSVRPMDGILSDMRALVTATRRFVLAAAGEVTRQARVSAHVTELGASSGGAPEWREDDEPRELERGWETRDDLPIEGDDTEDTKETEEVASSGPRHGIWIAAGTFVPTFLTIVLGATYLAGLPMGTRLAPVGKGDPQPVVSVVGSPRGSVDTQRQADAPTMETAGGADKPSRVPSPSTREALDKAAVPRLRGFVVRLSRTGTQPSAWPPASSRRAIRPECGVTARPPPPGSCGSPSIRGEELPLSGENSPWELVGSPRR